MTAWLPPRIKLRFGTSAFASLASVGIKFGNAAITFFLYVYLARIMTAEAYGVFAAAFSLATVAAAFGSVGQHMVTLRFWPILQETYGSSGADQIIRSSIRITAIGCSIVAMVLVAASLAGLRLTGFGTDPRIFWAIALLAFAFAFSDLAISSLRVRGHIFASLLPREIIWRLGAILIFAVGAVAYSAVEVTMVLGIVLLLIVALQFWAIKLKRGSASELAELSPAIRKDIARSHWGQWGVVVAFQLTQYATTIAVALTLGPYDAGLFFAASRVAGLLGLPLIAINQIIGPTLSRLWFRQEIERLAVFVSVTTAGCLALAIAGLVIFGVFGRLFLGIFDPAYADGYVVLLIIGLAQVVNTACGPNNLLLLMTGHERALLVIRLVSSVIAVGGAALGAWLFGILGAAVASLLAMLVLNIASSILCFRRLGVRPMELRHLSRISETFTR